MKNMRLKTALGMAGVVVVTAANRVIVELRDIFED